MSIKRLKKKAWEKITLYHATSSQALLKIVQDGQILPGGYIDQTSNGIMNPNNELIPSGEQGGVYLGDEHVMFYYYDGAINNTHEDITKPNIPVRLTVEVDTDALIPDYDDLSIDLDMENPSISDIKNNLLTGNDPLWKQSLDRLGQVIHLGPIDVSAIKSVQFILSHFIPGSVLESRDKMSNIRLFAECGIRAKVDMSLNDAIDALHLLYDKIDEMAAQQNQPQYQTASKIKRLIRY